MATDSAHAVTPTVVPAAALAPRPARRRVLDEVYPTVPKRALTLRTALLASLGLVVAVVVNLFRTSGPGAMQTMWIEDVIVFMNDAYNKPFGDVLFHPESGYFHVVPRILAEIAAALPVRGAAPALALEAATVWGVIAVIVFMASRPFLPQWWLRLLIAAPVVLVPAGHTQIDNDVATLHHLFLYGLFWVMLWQPPTRLGKAVAVLVAALAAMSSILAVVFIPFAFVRLWVLRSWPARLVSLVYLAGMTRQLLGLATGQSVPVPREGNDNLLWALKEYAITAVPRSIFGELWLGGPKVDVSGNPTADYDTHSATEIVLIVVALLIVAALVVVALRGLTHPHWPLAILAAGYGIAIFCESSMIMGVIEPRYVMPAALFLYVTMVAMLRPRTVEVIGPVQRPDVASDEAPEAGPAPTKVRLRAAAPVLAFALLVAVAMVANYRVENARSTSPAWNAVVRDAAIQCRNPATAYYFYGHAWWNMNIPCDRLR